jgi:hypothetical protein
MNTKVKTSDTNLQDFVLDRLRVALGGVALWDLLHGVVIGTWKAS